MESPRESRLDCETRTIVHVEYIPGNLKRHELQILFSTIGPVEHTIFMGCNQSESFGFVFFSQPQDALTAVGQFDGHKILGRTLRVSLAQTVEAAMENGQNVDEAKTNLIVNYLPESVNCEELTSLFSTCGDTEQCTIMIDNSTGNSKCYGFVNFYSPADAAKAIDLFNGLKIQNKRMKVSYARPCSQETKGSNLYVRNLPRNVSEEDVRVLFGRFGKIISCRLIIDKSARPQHASGNVETSSEISKGLAFVLYAQRSDAETAIRELDGVLYRGNYLVVKFSRNDGRAQLSRRYQRQFPLPQQQVSSPPLRLALPPLQVAVPPLHLALPQEQFPLPQRQLALPNPNGLNYLPDLPIERHSIQLLLPLQLNLSLNVVRIP